MRCGSDDENAHGRGRPWTAIFPGAAQTVQFYSCAEPKIAVISRATRRANMSALQPKAGVSVESRARREDQGEILGVNARKKLGAAIGLIGLERSRGSSSIYNILFWGDDSGGTAASVCKTLADRKAQALGSHTCRSRRRRIAQRAKALVSTVGCTTEQNFSSTSAPRASPAAVTKQQKTTVALVIALSSASHRCTLSSS